MSNFRFQEVYDSSIKKADIINYVKLWVKTYKDDLLKSWESAKKGRALEVPNELPPRRKLSKKSEAKQRQRIDIELRSNLTRRWRGKNSKMRFFAAKLITI
jgi:hypothetical protein